MEHIENSALTVLVTVGEAAKALRVSTQTIRNLCAAGDLLAIRVGERGVRIDRQSLADYLDRQPAYAR
jgi:excisionase family DNA binding protein